MRQAVGQPMCRCLSRHERAGLLPDVEEAARELKRLEADAVIAVGGGSAVVTARAASILLAEAQVRQAPLHVPRCAGHAPEP